MHRLAVHSRPSVKMAIVHFGTSRSMTHFTRDHAIKTDFSIEKPPQFSVTWTYVDFFSFMATVLGKGSCL